MTRRQICVELKRPSSHSVHLGKNKAWASCELSAWLGPFAQQARSRQGDYGDLSIALSAAAGKENSDAAGSVRRARGKGEVARGDVLGEAVANGDKQQQQSGGERMMTAMQVEGGRRRRSEQGGRAAAVAAAVASAVESRPEAMPTTGVEGWRRRRAWMTSS